MRKKKVRVQRWVHLHDGDFQFVLPDWDIKPHGIVKISKTKYELAGYGCPCNPEFQIMENGNILITHNSFIDKSKIEKSMAQIYEANCKRSI
jgi:hypothetical protein